MIKKCRKKPVVIEAIRFTENTDSNELAEFMGMDIAGVMAGLADDGFYIQTLEGVMKADDGDYIIKGVKGEFYPCKPDIFEQTYEEVPDGEQ